MGPATCALNLGKQKKKDFFLKKEEKETKFEELDLGFGIEFVVISRVWISRLARFGGVFPWIM